MGQMIVVHEELLNDVRSVASEIQNEDAANYIMYQLGFSEGTRMANEYGGKVKINELRDVLINMCVQSGVTAVKPEKIEESNIVVEPYNSSIDDSYYIAGYVAGIVSFLLDKGYSASVKDTKLILRPTSLSLEEMIKRKTIIGSKAKKPIQTVELENGEIYAIKDNVKNPASSFNIFLGEVINNKRQGLIFTRIFPGKVDELYLSKQGVEVPTIWLTTRKTLGDIVTIDPSRYNFELRKNISDFVNNNNNGIVMLHGLEFLIQRNSFDEILKFIQDMRDVFSSTGNIMIIPTDPEALEGNQYNKLMLELNEYGVK
ncbi:MAG: DUF835 domain-containing protein [Nanoarchaeota archaeon]|nr:DUF835 domain-containing protein [Nanoarchaeota archaeon]